MRSEWPVAALWCCFLLRLGFYSAALPLWEGFDEWAHFSVVRAVAHGSLLPPRAGPLPRDVEESMRLAPAPRDSTASLPSAVTHDDFWQLAPAERAAREAALRALPSDFRNQRGSSALRAYEGLQPPLYYWLTAPVLWLAGAAPLTFQVLLLRLASVLIASMVVPFAYLAARDFFRDSRLALGCAAVVALMPELAFDVARAGNDCLAVLLFTVLTWLALRVARENRATALALGIVLGLGLLTKAYFLAAIPPLLLILAPLGRGALVRGLLPAVPIAGWWYLRNLLTTGTFTGLNEAVMLRGKTGFLLLRAGEVPWRTALDSILLSHLWYGGWSGLTIRSWMYHLFYLAIAAAAAGCCLQLRSLFRPLAIYGFFWLAQFYNVLLLFLSKGVPTSMGWYLYAAVAAEAILCVAGLRALLPKRAQYWPPLAGAFLFAALDLYTWNAVAAPYYTGLIRHRANGALAAVHVSDYWAAGFGEFFNRLAAFKPIAAPWLAAFWILYLLATAAPVILAARRR